MAQVRRVGSLEVEEDLDFQSRQWPASRALWAVLLALMLATVLGVFGSDPLSRQHAGAPDAPLRVEYERVARFGSSVRLVVHARPQPDGDVRFALARSLLDAFRVRHVTPAPSSSAIVERGVEYRFRAGRSGTATVIFEMQPAIRWSVHGQIESPDGAVHFSQFILP
jgi:hypothetical protein